MWHANFAHNFTPLPALGITAMDFDVLVAGHLTRLGTKDDIQIKVDFFADILAGAQLGLASVSAADVAAGTGVNDPTNPNAGNSWCVHGMRLALLRWLASGLAAKENEPPCLRRSFHNTTGAC